MRTRGREVRLEQGSPEWLEWRKGGVGGSDAAIIKMWEKHPFSSPYQLWQLKLGLITEKDFTKEQFAAVQRGHELEPEARREFIKRTGIWVEPVCFEHPEFPFVRASLDGTTTDREAIAEIKCPIKWEIHEKAVKGEVAEYYYCQVQYQLAVTGAKLAYFFSYFPDAERPEDVCALVEVKPNPVFMEDLLHRVRVFWKNVQRGIPPTESHMPTSESAKLGQKGIIQVTGYARAGKDTIGTILRHEFGMKKFAYADALKSAAIDAGVCDERVWTDSAYKKKVRPKLVAFGRAMRNVDPNVWVNGIFNPRSGLYEAAQTTGIFITDCRYANEVLVGILKASELEVPHRLVWVERKGATPQGEEDYTTRYLKNIANIRIENDFTVEEGLQEGVEWPQPLEDALCFGMSVGEQKLIKASAFWKGE